MRTLGASNPHNNNKDKHRANTRITGDTVERVFTPGNQGLDNQGFDGPSSNTDDEVSTTARNLSNRLHHRREASSSDQGNTSSATSKM